MKHTVAILSLLTSVILLAGSVWAEQYREGKVYVTRPGSLEPALERSSMGASRDDERIVDAKDPVVKKREKEKVPEERRTRIESDDRNVIVRRESERDERDDRRDSSPSPKTARDASNSSRTSPRGTKVDFIDKNKDGYDDRKDVHDL